MSGYLFPNLPPVGLKPASGRVSLCLAMSLTVQSFLQHQHAPSSLNHSLLSPLFFLLQCSDFSKQSFITLSSNTTFDCMICFFSQDPDQTGTHPVKVTLWGTWLVAEQGPPSRRKLTPPVGAEKEIRLGHWIDISRSLLCRPQRRFWPTGGKSKSVIINGDHSKKQTRNR